MDTCPIRSFPKIWHFGSVEAMNIFNGPVEVTEKVDGSQFAFGRTVNGELVLRSKGTRIYPESCPAMFRPAVESVLAVQEMIPTGVTFYAEAVTKPKHNVLSYAETPKGYLALFGVFIDADANDLSMPAGKWTTDRQVLENYASMLHIGIVPLLYSGVMHSRAQLDDLLKTKSFLGNETIEGVVIKNYNERAVTAHGTTDCFAKLVRPEFKERHQGQEHVKSNVLDEALGQWKTDARYLKAIQHLRDDGKLTGTPKDIGPLIVNISEDLLIEEEQNIKEMLFKAFRKQIVGKTVHDFPEFYKKYLIDQGTKTLGA